MRYQVGIICHVIDTERTTKCGTRKLVEITDGYKLDSRLVPVNTDVNDMIGTNFLDW